jgi:threonine/homoserine/homoserine lactone efflux protein
MDLLSFVATVIIVTASGALAPGPLFFATVSEGAKHGPKTGIIFSIAHTIVEFSLIMIFALGLLTIASEEIVQVIIGIAGGIVLILFGAFQIRNSFKIDSTDFKKPKSSYKHLFLLGLAFTGLNPYFVLWWLTAGAELILISLAFAGLLGVVFMYICHVWMDYVWLTSVAYFSKKGTNIFGLKWFKPLLIIFGAALIFFGLRFIIGAVDIYI